MLVANRKRKVAIYWWRLLIGSKNVEHRKNCDWKRIVAIYRWRLLTGNHELVELASVDDQWCRHLPVAPIDWKPIQFVNDPGNYGWESLVAGGAY